MDVRNIITEISPQELRLRHIKHDMLHNLLSEDNIIFREKSFKDGSCTVCRGLPPESRDDKYRPLQKWIDQGNVIPSWDTYNKFTLKDFRTTLKRKQSSIFEIIELCRFEKYPINWDNTFGRLEAFIDGNDATLRSESYLPDKH